MMEQVVLNLCVNARDAMPNGGRLAIGTRELSLGRSRASGQSRCAPGAIHLSLGLGQRHRDGRSQR